MAALEKKPNGIGTDLVPVQTTPPVTLFRTENPNEVVARASETANALAAVVKAKKLTTSIQGRDHVRVEGWTLLGSMLGVFPICVWSKKLEGGWEARVEARTLAGQLVGAAEAQCLRSEKTWANRDDYALRSMAQTRATSKALRQPLGFVMTLAGFDATPAEEMIVEAEFEPVTQFVPPDTKKPTKVEKDKLVNLVGELVLANHITPNQVANAAGGPWPEIVDSLSKQQVKDLTERLDRYQQTVTA